MNTALWVLKMSSWILTLFSDVVSKVVKEVETTVASAAVEIVDPQPLGR
jgi:hypothetical protein